MRERQGGVSSIHSFKSVYYMIKVSLALIIDRLLHPQEQRGPRMTAQLQLFMILGAVVLLLHHLCVFEARADERQVQPALACAGRRRWSLRRRSPTWSTCCGTLLAIEMPVNLVFLLMFCFVLVVLLSLSIAISQLADKCKRLTQANAMLEKRVRDLEEKNR